MKLYKGNCVINTQMKKDYYLYLESSPYVASPLLFLLKDDVFINFCIFIGVYLCKNLYCKYVKFILCQLYFDTLFIQSKYTK